MTLSAIGLCAFFAGRAATHLIEQAWLMPGDETSIAGGPGSPLSARRPVAPPPVEKTHSKDTDKITSRDVFCSSCAPPVVKATETVDGGTTDPGNCSSKTTLSIELVSTMWVDGDEKWSIAVIRDLSTKEKEGRAYNQGKKMDSGAEILRVDPKRVFLLNGGHCEFVEMDGAEKPKVAAPAEVAVAGDPLAGDVAKGVHCTGSNCVIDRPLLDKLLANTTALATAARFVPSVANGKPNGFKLYAIQPSSIFGKIGLQNGDTIKSINGMEMASPDQALGIYTKLRTASHLSVAIERRGENTTMDYTIQ